MVIITVNAYLPIPSLVGLSAVPVQTHTKSVPTKALIVGYLINSNQPACLTVMNDAYSVNAFYSYKKVVK